MIFWGTTLSGDRLLLGEPAEAALSYDRDAPADLLRVKFPVSRMWEELREISLYEGGKPVFRGVVDEQNTTLSSSGLTLELVCRSMEALLLDNEAQPETILAPSLPLLEKKLLLPLGLALGEGDRDRKRGELAVDKGESVWTVLEQFCRDFLGIVPYVDLNGLVQCGGVPGKALELKDVISAQVNLLPCKRVTEVWQQSGRGGYDTPYRSEWRGAVRRRYFSAQSGKSPRQALEEGERNSFLLTVTCAGARWPGRNASASVSLPGMGRFENCPVRSALYRRDQSGERTRLVLEKGEGSGIWNSQAFAKKGR